MRRLHIEFLLASTIMGLLNTLLLELTVAYFCTMPLDDATKSVQRLTTQLHASPAQNHIFSTPDSASVSREFRALVECQYKNKEVDYLGLLRVRVNTADRHHQFDTDRLANETGFLSG